MSTTSLFDILSEVRGTKLTKIAQIDRVIDWAPVRAVIETVYTTGSAPTGRPSYDGLMLFKIELLRVWYGLRDEGVEEMVNDRISFSRFVKPILAAPDSTTVLRSSAPWPRAAVRRMERKDRIMRWAARGKGLSARYMELAKTHAQHVMEAIALNLYHAPGSLRPTPKKTKDKA